MAADWLSELAIGSPIGYPLLRHSGESLGILALFLHNASPCQKKKKIEGDKIIIIVFFSNPMLQIKKEIETKKKSVIGTEILIIYSFSLKLDG